MEKLVLAGSGQALAFAASYSAVLVLLGVVLTIRVIAARRERKIGLGDGGDKDMLRRVRAHGNFAETAPLLIGVLILLVLLGAREWQVHYVGLAGLVGRIMHAIGVSQSAGSSLGRVGGMMLTFFSLIGGALMLLYLAWS